jgi:quercetin dioxygenase-like cupin family protein
MTDTLDKFPVHLGLGATAIALPEFTGGAWYEAYEAAHAADGAEGRLVTLFTFTEDWDSWEMHPAGEELVVCTAGTITLIQELSDGSIGSVTLDAGGYAINPRGVWHTADVAGSATVLFVTPGMGTAARPR